MAITFFCAPIALAEDPELEAVDELIAPLINDQTPGLGVLVMKDGAVLHIKGYGVSDINFGKRVDADTLFDLASLAKSMTALAAMLQMNDGLYDRDTPISKLLPVFAKSDFKGRAVTVGDLVHHLGGLPDYLSGGQRRAISLPQWLRPTKQASSRESFHLAQRLTPTREVKPPGYGQIES